MRTHQMRIAASVLRWTGAKYKKTWIDDHTRVFYRHPACIKHSHVFLPHLWLGCIHCVIDLKESVAYLVSHIASHLSQQLNDRFRWI